MKLLASIFLISCLCSQAIAQSGHWRTITTPTQKDLLSVSFPTPKTGYISGRDGLLMKSTDSGEHWQVIPMPGVVLLENASDIIDIQFLTEDVGYLIVSNQASPAYVGELYTTSDGGETWSEVPHEQNIAAYRVHFANEDFGLLAGSAFFQGKVVCRNNAGNWGAYQSLSFDPNDFIRGIDLYNAQRGAICGDSGLVYTTDDSGITWVAHPVVIGGPLDSAITGIRFLDENTLIATTTKGTYPAVISHDFGDTWEILLSPITFNYPVMTAVAICSNDSAVIVGRDANNWSFNGYVNWWDGSAWQQEQLEYGLNDVNNQTGSTVFAVGDTGTVITNKPLLPIGIHDIAMTPPFRIFPNPAHQIIEINYDAGLKIKTLQLFDISGRQLMYFQGAKKSIDVSGLPAETYLLKIASSKGVFTEKLILN